MRTHWIVFLLKERLNKLEKRCRHARRLRKHAWMTSSPGGARWAHYKRMCDRYDRAIEATTYELQLKASQRQSEGNK